MPMYDPIHDTVVETESPQPRENRYVEYVNGAPVVSYLPTEDEEEQPEGEGEGEGEGAIEWEEIKTKERDSTPGKPVILKHRLTTHNGKGVLGSNKGKRVSPGKNATVLISARSRHLKKEDGKPFWRKDIQYEFLRLLFDENTKAFRDPFPDSSYDVHINGRLKDPETGKISFAELYIKTIAHSPKCSKVLKDRLLNDMKMSIPTCMICLLVNVGRMNTTINFVPDMKSQLRTYHSIPSLQINYGDTNPGSQIDKNDKQLQDTPRLKSILKVLCDEPKEPNGLPSLENIETYPKTNIINLIFILCNAEESINKKFFEKFDYNFYDLLMSSKYEPGDRVRLFLWLIYNYLETNLSNEEIIQNPFGPMVMLRESKEDYDIDTEEELNFGETLYEQRMKFLAEDGDNERESLTTVKSPPEKIIKTPIKAPRPIPTHNITREKPEKKIKTRLKQLPPPKKHVVPPPPVLRQDIDVDKILKIVKNLKRQHYRKRQKIGLLKHEHNRILREELHKSDEDTTIRLRLKNYKGDYSEYSSRFNDVFKKLKGEYAEISKETVSNLSNDIQYQYDGDDLTLKSFKV